jgi:cell division protein ZapA (FtsZ GTPase activity inhibitor)
MSCKTKHSILILDETYTILSDEGGQAVNELALRVDKLMRTIAEQSGNYDAKRTAVFAALYFANELKRLENLASAHKVQESHLMDYINKELSSL